MGFRTTRLGTAALSGLVLAGCAGGAVTTYTYTYNRDVRGHVQYAAASGPAGAVIYNDPFADDANGAAVIAAMQRRNPGPPLTFVASAPDRPAYHVVVAFGAPATGTNDYCRATTPPPRASAPSSRIDVSAAFCLGGIIISEARASADRIDSPQDPRLARLMQDLLSALMPYNDPLYINDTGDSGM